MVSWPLVTLKIRDGPDKRIFIRNIFLRQDSFWLSIILSSKNHTSNYKEFYRHNWCSAKCTNRLEYECYNETRKVVHWTVLMTNKIRCLFYNHSSEVFIFFNNSEMQGGYNLLVRAFSIFIIHGIFDFLPIHTYTKKKNLVDFLLRLSYTSSRSDERCVLLYSGSEKYLFITDVTDLDLHWLCQNFIILLNNNDAADWWTGVKDYINTCNEVEEAICKVSHSKKQTGLQKGRSFVPDPFPKLNSFDHVVVLWCEIRIVV